ncbi:hypothetical protein KC340_g3609 [Hortaea werneckii]|nr:hypothetical protein KC342_g3947 [Hortaea werneckii]KAI7102551.1 hypothetical protein KC339_g5939 [Hortaea werneckii]KAI7243743.1 hypothetical protein KC365_g2010 [Hortaea werneckii]KAI7331909.1 hypothetical protein KC340_g3609 [Hortaea werneckii]KAI7405470.1 hypothetical protein KC328_g1391 [Hortaea werneckii]
MELSEIYASDLDRDLGLSPKTARSLEEREPTGSDGKVRSEYKPFCQNQATGQSKRMAYSNFVYPSVGNWESTDSIYDNAYNVRTPHSCNDGQVTGHVIPVAPKAGDSFFVTEYIVELQTMKLFIDSVNSRELPDGSYYDLPPIYCDFMMAALNRKTSQEFLPKDVPQRSELTASRSPIDRILEAHGSTYNWKVFVILERQINGFKESMWQYHQPRDQDYATEENEDPTQSSKARKNIRTTINVFSYLNVPDVHDKMVTVLNDIREELVRADRTWIADPDPNHTTTGIVEHWDIWLERHFSKMIDIGYNFVNRNVGELRDFWLGQPDSEEKKRVLLDCGACRPDQSG